MLTTAAVKYERRYPNSRISDSKTISGTFLRLREIFFFCKPVRTRIQTSYEHSVQHHTDIDEIIVDAGRRSLGISSRRRSKKVGFLHSMVWRAINQNRFILTANDLFNNYNHW